MHGVLIEPVTPLPDDEPPLALDACGLLNLAAAMPLEDVAAAVGLRLICVRQVADEALYLEHEVDGAIERRPVNLGGLDILVLESEELAQYVSLAATLDDGEAATLAAAQRRGWSVVTDDRKASRVARQLDPPVTIRTSASMLRLIAGRGRLAVPDIRDLLRRVEVGANFRPPPSDPDFVWWNEHAMPT